MAFTPKTVGGNIVADANGNSFFTYQTADTIATVVTTGYFKQLDGDGELTSGEDTANLIFSDFDIVLVQASDGLFQAEMAVTDTTVSCIAMATEV